MTECIKTARELKDFCKHLQRCSCIAVDTEFLRETTYAPVLCLVQIASSERAACIDALSDLDLSDLFDVLKNPKILKVFHSCRQDIEIFYTLAGFVPAPLFDTQIGAMVCGFGENVSYHDLVERFLGVDLDKASRVTDWSKRPLTEEQLDYAANDVTYLIRAYKKMKDELVSSGRDAWILEEMQALENPKLYYTDPQDAWLRIKPLSTRPKYLAVLQGLCAWREEKAKAMNKPRRYVMRDEVLLQLASLAPVQEADFSKLRQNQNVKAAWQAELIAVVKNALDSKTYPEWARPKGVPLEQQGALNVLKLLLEVVCANQKVAPKMVATTEDLQKFVLDDKADIPALQGWRREVFGQKALDFKAGKLALFFNPRTHQTEWFYLKK